METVIENLTHQKVLQNLSSMSSSITLHSSNASRCGQRVGQCHLLGLISSTNNFIAWCVIWHLLLSLRARTSSNVYHVVILNFHNFPYRFGFVAIVASCVQQFLPVMLMCNPPFLVVSQHPETCKGIQVIFMFERFRGLIGAFIESLKPNSMFSVF